MKYWELPEVSSEQAQALSHESGLSPLLCKVLLSRGMGNPQEAAAFLGEGWSLHDPFLMRDMEKAVSLIEEAMAEGELIVIYGDYDCDGITSTVLLYRYLEERGARVAYYIPDREDEGYGLNLEACDALKNSGAGLVVTVDNGISASAEVDYLRKLGVTVVVTDHHQPHGELPAADAVLNPHREDCGYPFPDLAGVGVAFKLVCALEGDCEGVETLARYGDLVATGTVADVVPLKGENRIIVREGLRCLEETENPGLRALLEQAGIQEKPYTASSVAFGLAPRLNAASRMGSCEKSVDLMLCDDEAEAKRLAGEVDAANRERKSLEGGIMEDITRQIAEDPSLLKDRVLVLSGEGWHRGVIGIVASRVVERYGRPCLLVSTVGEEARASGRSVPGFSIIEAIHACAPLLQKYGGHTLAAGLSLRSADVPSLRRELNRWAAEHFAQMPVLALHLDAVLTAGELDILKLEELSRLEPFGAENGVPLFLLAGARIEEITSVGEGKHLRMKFSLGGRSLFAVYFGMTTGSFPYRAGELVDLAAQVEVSSYGGQKRISIKIKDIHPAGFNQERYFWDVQLCQRIEREEPISGEQAAEMVPSRDQVAWVYRTIRRERALPFDVEYLYLSQCREKLSFAQTQVALQVLLEAGLIGIQEGSLGILPAEQKVNLEETRLLCRLRAYSD